MEWLELKDWEFNTLFSWIDFVEIVITLFDILFVELTEQINIIPTLHKIDYIQNVIFEDLTNIYCK